MTILSKAVDLAGYIPDSFRLLCRLLDQAGNYQAADKVARQGMRRYPENTLLVEQLRPYLYEAPESAPAESAPTSATQEEPIPDIVPTEIWARTGGPNRGPVVHPSPKFF